MSLPSYFPFTESIESAIIDINRLLEGTLLLNPCILYNAVDASYGVSKCTFERSYKSANTSIKSTTSFALECIPCKPYIALLTSFAVILEHFFTNGTNAFTKERTFGLSDFIPAKPCKHILNSCELISPHAS